MSLVVTKILHPGPNCNYRTQYSCGCRIYLVIIIMKSAHGDDYSCHSSSYYVSNILDKATDVID